MSKALMVLFFLAGAALWLFGVFFGAIMWGLPGLLAFAFLPPLELLLPFIVWFTSSMFPAEIFAVWAIQIAAGATMVALDMRTERA